MIGELELATSPQPTRSFTTLASRSSSIHRLALLRARVRSVVLRLLLSTAQPFTNAVAGPVA